MKGKDIIMKELDKINNTTYVQAKISNLVGFYSATILTLITIITFILALMAVPISGANAPGGGLPYPYLETLKQFPKDYLWMFTALILILTYMVVVISIHSSADNQKKIFSQIGLVFAIMSAVILLTNYFVQITVVPASLTNNETAGITLITQYNPHGLFIALEEVGYILMNLSLLFIALIFDKKSRLESFIKWIFIIPLPVTITSLIMISFKFGIERKDRFEVVVLSVAWIVLIINGILLSIFFNKRLKTK